MSGRGGCHDSHDDDPQLLDLDAGGAGREERARTIRARQDREKTPEDRLEETLRLSKLMSELQQGAARDVPGR